MGRKKKYNTPEELAEARKQYAKNFYERNKERLNNASMKKYYELQESLRANNNKSSI
jgi:cyclopropane fatty-acyl-phospholipid synthase-like methyltransferase